MCVWGGGGCCWQWAFSGEGCWLVGWLLFVVGDGWGVVVVVVLCCFHCYSKATLSPPE